MKIVEKKELPFVIGNNGKKITVGDFVLVYWNVNDGVPDLNYGRLVKTGRKFQIVYYICGEKSEDIDDYKEVLKCGKVIKMPKF